MNVMERELSSFPNATTARPVGTLTVSEAVDLIRSDRLKADIERLRGLLTTGDRAGYDAGKRSLPAVTWSGVFKERNKSGLVSHSGLVVQDLDHLGASLPAVRAALEADPAVAVVFTSPSGDGIKAVYAVGDMADHGRAWRAVADRVAAGTGIEPDKSGKDISRLCFLSHDPACFFRSDPVPVVIPTEPEPPKIERPAPSNIAGKDFDVEAWCGRVGLHIAKVSPWEDATKYQLQPCPFNANHAEAAILKHPSGAVSFTCFHNGCVDNDWQALREMKEPGRTAMKRVPTAQEGIEADGTDDNKRVELVCASDIKPEPIEWIWDGWLAAGKMHILAGAPGCGKTTLTMALAATVTSGGAWPDGSTCEPGNVVIWSGEDDPADTLTPRLVLSGADLRRVFFISGVKDGQGTRPFDPASDILELRKTLERVGNVRLLVVDPLVSAVAGDSHKNAEVRRDLQKLVDLAGDIRCGLIGISHLTKGSQGREPLERVTGSLAFGALTRIAWFAVKPQPDAEGNTPPRLFLRVKSNIGPDNGGFEYDLCQDALPENPDVISSFARWGRPTDGDNRAIISDAETLDDDGAGGSLGEAKRFLRDLLENGALTVKAIKQEADGAGLAWATIRRAQRDLGIRPAKEDGRNGQWKWKLPVTCSTSPITCSPKKHEHLEQVEQVTPVDQDISGADGDGWSPI